MFRKEIDMERDKLISLVTKAQQGDQDADDQHKAADEIGVALGLVGGHPPLAAGVGEEVAHLAESAHAAGGEDEEQQTRHRLGDGGVETQCQQGNGDLQEPQQQRRDGQRNHKEEQNDIHGAQDGIALAPMLVIGVVAVFVFVVAVFASMGHSVHLDWFGIVSNYSTFARKLQGEMREFKGRMRGWSGEI